MRLCSACLILISCAVPGWTAPITQNGLTALLDITAGGSATEPLADAVAGWEFAVQTPVIIAALGLWDEAGAPLNIAHQVGLWNADGSALLRTTVVNDAGIPVASASGLGRWLFTDVPALTLQPGVYVLGAVWGDPAVGADPFRLGVTAITSPDILYSGACSVTMLSSPILVFPSCGPSPQGSFSTFGPNIAVAAVPEPASEFLAAFGCFALALLRRRRR